MRREPKFDYKQVENFGMCHISAISMSRLLGMSEKYILKLLGNDKSKFHRAYYKGQAKVEFELSRKMLASALGKEAVGNTALIANLCGQWLGWRKLNVKDTSKDEAAENLLKNVSEAQKTEIFSMVSGVAPDTEMTIDDGT